MVKNSPASVGDIRDAGSIPESERSPGGGSDNPLQCSCLKNPMDRGAWWATIHGVANSQHARKCKKKKKKKKRRRKKEVQPLLEPIPLLVEPEGCCNNRAKGRFCDPDA